MNSGGIVRFVSVILNPRKVQKFIKKKVKKNIAFVISYFGALYSKQCNKISPGRIRKINKNNERLVSQIKGKCKINVAFFVLFEAIWQYEELYRIMEKSDTYKPVLVVIPFIFFKKNIGKNEIIKNTNSLYEKLAHKKYNVISSYNSKTGKFVDVSRLMKFDIVFFTYPHSYSYRKYHIKYWSNKALGCYAPYSSLVSNLYFGGYSQPFYNYLFKYFTNSEIHKSISVDLCKNNGVNVEVTGYSKYDSFFIQNYIPLAVWKKQNIKKKKVIWSPHHTIYDGGHLNYSDFIQNHQYMIDLARQLSDTIQFAFKPHPALKQRLYGHIDWGVEKTDAYYNLWANMDNSQLEEGDYKDLFLLSDGIINSSGSFVAEYLCLNKPCILTIKENVLETEFNKFGKMCITNWYKAEKKDDICNFLKKRIIEGCDPLKDRRTEFIRTNLIPPNNTTASENIYRLLNSNFMN